MEMLGKINLPIVKMRMFDIHNDIWSLSLAASCTINILVHLVQTNMTMFFEVSQQTFHSFIILKSVSDQKIYTLLDHIFIKKI